MTKRNMDADCIIIGGGAAGFFGAIRLKEYCPQARVILLERGSRFLQKVSVSGGGRCNVTHDCYDPRELVQHYPRGGRELLGPFHRWQPADMLNWLAERGIETQAEADGRIFPVSNDSQTIIDCFLYETRRLQVELRKGVAITDIRPLETGGFELEDKRGTRLQSRCLLLASGGLKQEKERSFLLSLQHGLVPPVPSLFTFNIRDPRLEGLQGISVPAAEIRLPELELNAVGPVLITHWGLSGPGILKLSAWAARALHQRDYRYQVEVNWLQQDPQTVQVSIAQERRKHGKRLVASRPPKSIPLPERLWSALCKGIGLDPQTSWAHLNKERSEALCKALTASQFAAEGKSTNKEEFVTCGGIPLEEVDFKRLESKFHPGLFFAGEVLDIDAVTGGFNFQAAWTTSTIAAEAMAEILA